MDDVTETIMQFLNGKGLTEEQATGCIAAARVIDGMADRVSLKLVDEFGLETGMKLHVYALFACMLMNKGNLKDFGIIV